MYKPKTKKMLTVLIAVAMIFSALAVMTLVSQPAYAAASGTVTYNPTTFGVQSGTAMPTEAFVSGGTFSSGATVYFYLSSTDSASGLMLGGYAIGGTILNSTSPTSLDQPVLFFPNGHVVTSVTTSGGYTTGAGAAISPGKYYILASQVTPPTTPAGLSTGAYAFPAAASEFVVQEASLTILNPITFAPALVSDNSPLTVGSSGLALGQNFDPGSSVTVYLGYPGGATLTTATAGSTGSFEVSFTVPQLAGTAEVNQFTNTYTSIASPITVVAQETTSYAPPSFPQGGITADSAMDIAPSLTVSPVSISGSSGATLTLTGTGFPAGGVMSASSSSAPSNSIQIAQLNGGAPVYVTYHSKVVVSSNGQFSASVTIASAITTTGPYGVVLNIAGSAPYVTVIYDLFTPALFVSVPDLQAPGFFFEPVPVVPTIYNPLFSPIVAAVYNFPASEPVSFYIGTTLLGNATTDANGFAELPSSTVVPAMPGGSYVVTADSSVVHTVAVPTTGIPSVVGNSLNNPFVVSPFFMATDNVSNLLTSDAEYVPQTGTIIVQAYGLAPNVAYYATDSWLSAIGVNPDVVFQGLVTGISVGTENAAGTAIYPAANGTLIFSYEPSYGYYGITTGTSSTIGFSSNVAGLAGFSFGYLQIGAPTVTLSSQTLHPGEVGVSVTVSNLITATSSIVSLYPGTSAFYNVFIGSSLITASAPANTTILTGSQLASGISFVVPSLPNGVYNVSVTYAGQSVSNALSPDETASSLAVVSNPGTAITSGGISTVELFMDGLPYGYAVAGYGLLANQPIQLILYNSFGRNVATNVPSTSGTYGEFLDTVDLNGASPVFSSSVAGEYSVVLSIGKSPSLNEFSAYYTVTPSLTFSSVFPSSEYIAPGLYVSIIGYTIQMYATGLSPGTYYDLYFGPQYMETVLYSNGMLTPGSFVVPVLPYGEYNVSLTYAGTHNVVVSAPFIILSSAFTDLQLTNAQGMLIDSAFPGQIVSFSWMPAVVPRLPQVSQTYAVDFDETGLAADVSWSVTIGGATQFNVSTASGGTIEFMEHNGNYTFFVNVAAGYVASISIGTITVAGATVTVDIVFTQITYHTVTFTETGLSSGTSWNVALAGSTETSDTSTIVFTVPNGNYAYVVEPAAGYLPVPGSGSVSVNNANVAVAITFSATTTYTVTFTQSGLSSGSWGVELNGITVFMPFSSPIVFNETPGTYTFFAQPVSGYKVSPSSGTITVTTADVTQAIQYIGPYTVTFTESGLSTGTSWSVIISSVRAPSTATAPSPIVFSEVNGTYTYIVTPISGFQAVPSSGTVVVNDSNVTVNIKFEPVFALTFAQTGLTAGNWYVALNGVTVNETYSTDIVFTVPAGTYSFVVSPESGLLPAPASGTVTVTAAQTVTITYTAAKTYAAIFSQSGLTAGKWNVTMGGIQINASYAGKITFYEPNGTYTFTASSPGYIASPSPGSVLVNGQPPSVELITFSLAPTYSVTFTETGLSSGSWYVTLNGTTGTASAPSTITFTEPNGNYNFNVTPRPGYTVSPEVGTVTVNGAAATVAITFTPTTVPTTKYGVTFTETGLSSGTWAVTLNGVTEHASALSPITFSEPNGSYFFNISAVSGLVPTPSSGTINVAGTAVSISVTFAAPVTSTVGSPSPVDVTVYLNGTAYTTLEATVGIVSGSVVLNGSFLMPNSELGSYWGVSLGWSQTTFNEFGTSPSTTGTFTQYIGSTTDFLGLAKGNGALLTGITPTEMADINASITSSISTALAVPLSELSANITALHGDIATITTSFGTMNATLQSINATVASIESGQVLVMTKLGSIETSLASLNASIASFNGNVVTINTTLGQIKTSLSSIGTTVTSNANGIATIKTDVGTIQGQIVSTNGNVSTIHTAVGNLTTVVNKINTNTQGFSTLEIFLIVAIVLILITLVIAFLAVNNTNKLAKKFEEQKKQ